MVFVPEQKVELLNKAYTFIQNYLHFLLVCSELQPLYFRGFDSIFL